MELFDKKYVHFVWDDSLVGKKCIYADDIDRLITRVNAGDWELTTIRTPPKDMDIGFVSYPFFLEDAEEPYRFIYIDPNYECKIAYARGETIQSGHSDGWHDVTNEPIWDGHFIYRVKPKVEKLLIEANKLIRILSWDIRNRNYNPTKDLEKAEQFLTELEEWLGKNHTDACIGNDHLSEWRIKPEKKSEINFRPFENCDELVQFWEDNYGNKYRPEGTMPLIWVMQGTKKSLITDFDNRIVRITKKWYEVSQLLGNFTFLDGKPCGVEVN